MCIENCNMELCKTCKNYTPKVSYYQQAKKKCDFYFEHQYGAKQPYCYSPSSKAHDMAKSVMCHKKSSHIKDAFTCCNDIIDYFEIYKSALDVYMYHLTNNSDGREDKH